MSNWDRAVAAMSERPIAVIVAGRVGLTVRMEAPAKQLRGVTNADGYVLFPKVPDVEQMPQANLFVDDPDSEFYGIVVDVPKGGHQFFIGMTAPPPVGFNIQLPPLVAKHPPLPHLEVRGNDFVDVNGARIVLNGTDQYCAFRQYRDDGPDALRAAIEESHEFGFVLWRVFMQGSMAQNNVLDLRPTETGYYDDVRPFVDHLNAHGIVPLLTIGVDNQDVRSPMAHWVRMDQLTNGAWRVLSYFNEWSKNNSDFNPEDIPPSSGLWSRGSDTSDVHPRTPTGPVLEFHPVRNYQTAMRDAVASPIELFEVQGYRGALIIDEPGRMGTNAHDSRFIEPKAVQAYARLLSTLCAAAVMHNFFGQRGLLMDGPTRACAAAWTKGMGS